MEEANKVEILSERENMNGTGTTGNHPSHDVVLDYPIIAVDGSTKASVKVTEPTVSKTRNRSRREIPNITSTN